MISSTASATLRIVAAGRGRTMGHPKIVETVLKLAPVSSSDTTTRLVYLGTATYDKDEPFREQTEGYRQRGCQVTKLELSEAVSDIPTSSEIRQVLESAQVIMVSGGNTLYAMNRWKQLGVDEILRSLVTSVVMCGGSAGAICCFEHGHSDSMDPTTFLHIDPNLTEEQKKDWQYIRVDGLGFLPALCVPHHDATQSNGLPRSLDSDAMMLELPEQPCLGIDENAALVVENGTARVVSTDDVGQCFLKQCQRTRDGYDIVSQAFDESRGSIPLEELWQGMVLSQPNSFR